MRKEALQLIQAVSPFDAIEAQHKEQTLVFIEENENCFFRTNLSGHLTTSAVVATPDYEKLLLIYHEKLQRWLQPGGHIEPEDESLERAALRELNEETAIALGIKDLHQHSIFDLDVHPIPARGAEPAHLHYDLRFLFIAEENTPISFGEWMSTAWLSEQADDSMGRYAKKLLQLAEAQKR